MDWPPQGTDLDILEAGWDQLVRKWNQRLRITRGELSCFPRSIPKDCLKKLQGSFCLKHFLCPSSWTQKMFPLLHQGSSSDSLNAHREDEKWEEWGFLDDLRVKHQTSSRGILLYMDVFKKCIHAAPLHVRQLILIVFTLWMENQPHAV